MGRLETRSRAFVVGASLILLLVSVGEVPSAAGQPRSAVDARAAALREAAATGKPVPVPSEFNRTTKVFANPDGTFTAYIAAGPVQVPSSESPTGWADIDTSLVEAQDGSIVPAVTDARETLSAGGAGPLVTIERGEAGIVFGWGGGELPQPSLSGSTATYAEVQPGTDLLVTALPEGVEISFVVKAPLAEPPDLRLSLHTDALQPRELGGGISFLDESGRTVATTGATSIYQASDHGSPTVVTPVSLWASGRQVSLHVPASLVASSDTKFPLTIDPVTSYTWDGAGKDTFVNSASPSSSYGTNTQLKLGFDGTNTDRTLIRFPVESQLGWDGSACPGICEIDSASLSFYENVANSCDADLKTFSIYQNTEGFSDNTTWSSKPSYDAGTVWAQLGANAGNTAHTSSPGGCSSGSSYTKAAARIPNASGTGSYVSNNMAPLVQDWATGEAENFGFTIKADDESAKNQWKTFSSTDAASSSPSVWPQLTVDYSYPNVPTSVSVNQSGTDAVLHATYSSPAGASGAVLYTITDSQGNIMAQDLSGADVASGGDSYVSINGSGLGLVQGTTYTLTAVAEDVNRVATSSSTSSQNFTYGYTTTAGSGIPSNCDPELAANQGNNGILASPGLVDKIAPGKGGFQRDLGVNGDTMPSTAFDTVGTNAADHIESVYLWSNSLDAIEFGWGYRNFNGTETLYKFSHTLINNDDGGHSNAGSVSMELQKFTLLNSLSTTGQGWYIFNYRVAGVTQNFTDAVPFKYGHANAGVEVHNQCTEASGAFRNLQRQNLSGVWKKWRWTKWNSDGLKYYGYESVGYTGFNTRARSDTFTGNAKGGPCPPYDHLY